MNIIWIWIMWSIGLLFVTSGLGAVANAIKENTKELKKINDDTLGVEEIINKNFKN